MIKFCKERTAFQLKEAGFPQPVPQKGDIWYEPVYSRGKVVAYSVKNLYSDKWVEKAHRMYKEWLYCPTAEDFVKRIGGFQVEYRWDKHQFTCITVHGFYDHEDLHECLALAYLYGRIQEKRKSLYIENPFEDRRPSFDNAKPLIP